MLANHISIAPNVIPKKRPSLDHNGFTFLTGERSWNTGPFIILFSYSTRESFDLPLFKAK